MPDTSAYQLLDTLLDIATNIQIDKNFTIFHPYYQPLTLSNQLLQRIPHLDQGLQDKFYKLLLRHFIHGIYYDGSLCSTLAINPEVNHVCIYEDLETKLTIDQAFYEELHSSNSGIGYFDAGWQVIRKEPDGSMAITKDGLNIYVENPRHLQKKSSHAGEEVALWMPKNRLQNNCYVALSDVQDSKSNNDAGQIYLNITSKGAIALMAALTQELNAAKITFEFQVPYHPQAYHCFDSGKLYFPIAEYPLIREILQTIYPESRHHFQPQTPLFTKFLAPGMSFAELPLKKFSPQETFGINRCQIVANALFEAWQQGNNSSSEKIELIEQHFAWLDIDLHHPYLNPSSPDIYQPLKA
ncbi:T3SS effector HopA1 family protein [Calothrix sp. 336/3]|uniref:T3SS effector HopA1 family protein n=1 Tax=Calothrix sp. 336/3 TaxID=1337936 RepID=UPI0004E35C74|nr:T3SS effector HopA1 family protein [Calothrix sp. 336/3]AKG22310.1 hypothetical protein IJ00_14490 [Calothrix sp. 336/3]